MPPNGPEETFVLFHATQAVGTASLSHDDLDVRSDSPDYFAWLELKKQNLGLKREIEIAWAREGLPTNEDLRLRHSGRTASAPTPGPRFFDAQPGSREEEPPLCFPRSISTGRSGMPKLATSNSSMAVRSTTTLPVAWQPILDSHG